MRPLLVCSLGNPGSAYSSTLHSAGHVMLMALIRQTMAPLPVKDGRYGKGSVSRLHPDYVLWRSESFMNTSGPGLAAAWRSFLQDSGTSQSDAQSSEKSLQPKMIILHDELELNCGLMKVSSGAGRSARGHNGLKSFLKMPGMQELDFFRVGIGIGPRPLSRSADDVAAFVLRKLTASEKISIEHLAVILLELLDQVQSGQTVSGKFGQPLKTS